MLVGHVQHDDGSSPRTRSGLVLRRRLPARSTGTSAAMVRVVDNVQLGLTVVSITVLGGITQATVQAVLAGRATRVAARQQAVQAEIALLLKLQEHLADMGQACNDYGLELFEEEFFTRKGWSEKRRPLLQRLTTCQARVMSTAHALPSKHPARDAALTAGDVAMDLARQDEPEGEPKKINEDWTRDSPKIRTAIEVTGAAVRSEHLRLQDVTRNGVTHTVRRGVRALGRLRHRDLQP